MTAVQTAQRMTAEEFMATTESPDARIYELVEGEVVVASPTGLHGDIQRDLLVALTLWTRAAPDRGKAALPRDVQLDELNVFAPDVLWYRKGREPGRHDPPPYPVPDIVAEIRSPSTWRFDIGAKKAAYERHGLSELWLVDSVAYEVLIFSRSEPNATSFDLALELGRGDALESPLLPGFSLAMSELYPE